MMSASHQQSFAATPLVPLASAFAAGIVLSEFIPLSLQTVLLVAASCMSLSFLGLIFRAHLAALAFIVLSFAALGWAFERTGTLPPRNSLSALLMARQISNDEMLLVTGVVDGPVNYAPDAVHFDIRVEHVSQREIERDVRGLIAVTLPIEGESAAVDRLDLRDGAVLRLVTALQFENRFSNPGVEGLSDYLSSKGYDAIAFIRRQSSIERLDDRRSWYSLGPIYDWRQKLERRIALTFSPDTAGVLNAAFIGSQYGLSKDVSTKFREGGTFHVLVISGMHISFIGAVMFSLSRRATRNRAVQFSITNLFLWAYTFGVGANASVVRASVMFSFMTFAPILARRAVSLNALAAAALLLLVHRPAELFNPSFQLTFLSVSAIVVFAWPLLQQLWQIGNWRPVRETPAPPRVSPTLLAFSELMYWNERRWRVELAKSTHRYNLFKNPLAEKISRWRVQSVLAYSFAAVLISFLVQVTMAPFLIYQFHRVSIAALVLNIVVGILIVLLASVATIALLFSVVSWQLSWPWVKLAEALNWVMVNSVEPFSHLRIASLRVPEYTGRPFAIYVLYFIPLVCLAIAVARWRPLNSIPTCRTKQLAFLFVLLQLAVIVLVVGHPCSATYSRNLRIDFLDVGQGDAALITMPTGMTLLVDGGGRPTLPKMTQRLFERDTRSIGDAVVSEFLWHRGLDRIDFVLPTHADADHIDGLNDVVSNFALRGAMVARTPVGDPEFQRFRKSIKQHTLPEIHLERGDLLEFGDVSIEVLWPARANANAPSRNNDSVVLLIKYGQRSLLLTGDIEAAAEAAIVQLSKVLDVDVVKVPHHGSKSSSTAQFVAATRPHLAVVSVGRKSIFGHPHAEVVDRWKKVGAEVLTTGWCGTITVETDGTQLNIETFLSCRKL